MTGLRGTRPAGDHISTNDKEIDSLKKKIQRLEHANGRLRAKQMDPEPINVQVFHRLQSNDQNNTSTYLLEEDLLEADREKYGKELMLGDRFLVPDPVGYAKLRNIPFIVYKYYSYSGPKLTPGADFDANKPPGKPEADAHTILLVSNEMAEAMKAFFAQTPSCTDIPKVADKATLTPPYTWWYHCRKSHDIQSLPKRQARLVMALVDWIEANYASLFDTIDEQLRRGFVSRISIPFLFSPGDILVSDENGVPGGHMVLARPQLVEFGERIGKESDRQGTSKKSATWRVPCQSLEYSGAFYLVEEEVKIVLETELPDDEVDIAALGVKPLKYAAHDAEETLKRRAKMWWKLRSKQLVSYDGAVPGGTQAGQRFMIDFNTYEEHHPTSSYSYRNQCSKMDEYSPKEDQGPQPPEIYLFPTMVPGFDLRREEWVDLRVDQIRDVVWNDKAFESLVVDEDMKEQILALVTKQFETEKSTDFIDNKRNGLTILLHGPTGTGKTFTAESVAEMARKPLYPVAWGSIGTEPEKVEKYLQSVLHLGKIWDCVVLLDDAEVFLEQRTLQDPKRNALVSVFLRALEYYEGILILTTNRVFTVDAASKSHILLTVHYELNDYQRKQIWRNFLNRLKEIGEGDKIDFDDIEMNLDELARYPINGWQIRNSVKTARQLAKYKAKKMTLSVLKTAIAAAQFS